MSVIPTMISLFGPVDDNGALKQAAPTTWATPGSGFTHHTFYFPFWKPLASFWLARWRVVWAYEKALPTTPTVLRLFNWPDVADASHFTGGGELGRISSADWKHGVNPWNAMIDITAPLNALNNTNTPNFNIGWQLQGDGVTVFDFYVSRLELYWNK